MALSFRDLLWRVVARMEIDDAGCWVWQGAKHPRGYGHMWVDGVNRSVHRIVYESMIGPIPSGLVLDHLCRNTSCCNPDHLDPVTQRENTLRGLSLFAVNAAKTHCPKGHPYDEINTRWYEERRYCRACRRLARPLEKARAKARAAA